MELSDLLTNTVGTLAPALPYLYAAGKEAGKEFAKKAGGAAFDQAAKLWNWLKPKAEAEPALQTAVADLAAQPDDADAQAALRLQLKKLLTAQPALVSELQAMVQVNVTQTVTQNVTGDRNIVSGRDTNLRDIHNQS
jgi:hypothetical protein